MRTITQRAIVFAVVDGDEIVGIHKTLRHAESMIFDCHECDANVPAKLPNARLVEGELEWPATLPDEDGAA